MDTLFKNAYFGKSFMMIGDELNFCFNCAYCRANDNKKLHYHILPSEINPYFINIPVAVNCFYGDPMLQIENTKYLLKQLENAHHKGPVFIITKGDVSLMDNEQYDLDLHIGLSTCGLGAENFDGGYWERFLKNCEYCHKHNYAFHIEFRPIIKNVNDSDESFKAVIEQASKYNVAIGYCGLQVSDNLKERLKEKEIVFEPYSEYGFSLKKFISKEIEDKFISMTNQYNVEIHKKTSCIVSSQKNKRDYNAHYYRPNEVGCKSCPNEKICSEFHSHMYIDMQYLKDLIPFDFEVVDETGHICSLYANGLCKFPSNDCLNISGKFIKINEKITTSDVRIIKWLTGMTVIAEFEEIPYINKKWIK
ncbi:MAG: hypothetical protein [Wendovervirus sonii]|uniref:Radical SAM superfamily protein n=1 Tax=phage Lak_Megaphage_Sonny TaxID=3109229 RepID=A0ABZ0Z3Q1_9CAUD|nr:MAG: hypothetical protein [phage Lak_Megaphage_Sonny]